MLTTDLPAGRELDGRIAVELMGWTDLRTEGDWLGGLDPDRWTQTVPYYSSDMAAAWQVVEQFQQRGYVIQITSPDQLAGEQWRCAADAPLQPNGHYRTFTCEAETAPLAICRIALAAFGVE